ncbi:MULTISPECIES: YibE/F family protein [Staphylococcus]|uniref:YibE/F family protein n=1 Tax=Staphylococcus TaxID=1279 RepID=UPI001E4B2241|nr:MULTISPECIES: YibE/F family protein [Staphylococcus]MCD8915233.1 YibE/F family protein [Staphylococcus simulans]UXV34894.1 YibE/F family protein [Staphylococcus sp. IVB6181]
MNAVLILALILFILMLIFGGKKGAVSYGMLFLNFVLVLLALVAVVLKLPIPIVAIVFCIIVASLNLFGLNGNNVKTQAAFYATCITTLVLLGAIYCAVALGHLQGFASEQQDETYVYSMNIGINMIQFMVFTTLLAVIAAVVDLAITISSPMYELNTTNPDLNRFELFQSGMRIGREILATSANTIYLAYFGGQLTLFFWFFKLDYSFGHIMNSKIFTQEFVSILFGGIAVAMSIPITAWITAWLIKRQHPKKTVSK